ncbi:MAG: ABC transporter ATP-binding protein [Haloferacaceae archaeon]
MPAVLVAEDVHKAYGETVALDGVSLSVDGGEVFGLIGPNGAGKTTLIRSLTGTTAVDGEIRVFGEPPTAADPETLSLLPQSFGPPERLTARELIRYYAGLYDDPRDAEGVLADVGLADDADTWYENLSGGQQRRACVGTALVNDPDLLFLDEPTTGIDPAGRRDLWGLVEDLADGGTTVFLTSHYMEEVERLADRVGLLSDGQIVATGSPEELIAEYGGESRLTVRTDGAPGALEGTDFTVVAGEEGLVFEGIEPTDIGEAVAALEANGVAYESLTWAEPGLEDVYLRLTGEAFGEGAGGGTGTDDAALAEEAAASPDVETPAAGGDR